MKLALIGYGAMGQLVAAQARAAGIEIGATVTSQHIALTSDELANALRDHDVAIDFSKGPLVMRHVKACLSAGVALVEGTTGWKDQEDDIQKLVMEDDGAMVFGANFSIGVNIFYRIVEHATARFAALEQYEAFIEEQHHSRKLDAPSGTALKLKALMTEGMKEPVSITSTRAGYIPGTHRVGFDSSADQVTLTHTARSREGFAAGALLAANWIVGRKGVYDFSEVIDEILK
jgi:4-hydroxy-tetrahydrodipicolinate reductase